MSDFTPQWVIEELKAFNAQENSAILENLNANTRLLDEGVVDSLSFIGLIMHLEEATGMSIDLSDFDAVDFETPETLSAALQGLKNEQ